jgi:hypothetical protein
MAWPLGCHLRQLGPFGYVGATFQHHPPLGGRSPEAAARDNRGVLFPPAKGGGRKARRAAACKKSAGFGQDLGDPLSGGSGGEGWKAIDRLRLIHTPRKKTVVILCNIPLGLPVDDLITWRQLVGDGRLTEALTLCEENGWDALPLVPGEIARLFPEVWVTEKAAERWLANNPLDPVISIIRLWGVIAEYRRMGRRGRWSKALVRHGADPGKALAAVLGFAAEDIHVKEVPG